jgi:outer membrane translocation and assembly module TamA
VRRAGELWKESLFQGTSGDDVIQGQPAVHPNRRPRTLCRSSWLLLAAALFAPGLLAGCASLPKNDYGIEEIRFRGVEKMSSQSLATCLSTKEREAVTIRLGLGGTSCGKPPFDQETPQVSLWSWPWETWPLYDPAIFDIDRKRILRWYQARGFYQAKVVGVRYEAGDKTLQPPERCQGDDCKLSIEIEVDEGDPVMVEGVFIAGDQALDRELRIDLRKAPEVKVGDRFDEATYELDKQALMQLLQENSFAQAAVYGKVELDRNRRSARIEYSVDPGPLSTFGTMSVAGNDEIPREAIMEVAGIKPGKPFKPSEISDAERAVRGLGVFSSVRIETKPRGKTGIIDLLIRVSIGRIERWRFGVGMLSGTMQRGLSDETLSIPEWDVHLRASYSHEDFLGGMRKLKLEERPRVIFLAPFPLLPDVGAQLGNTLTASFEQPRFIEPRTVLFVEGQWDYGPAPFLAECDGASGDSQAECVVFRHDLATKAGVRRMFWGQRISVQLALAHDLYEIVGDHPDNVSDYRLPYLEQQVRLDLRNDPHRPSRGLYVDNTIQEAVRPFGYGSWNYVRWLPEVRAYQRLFWRIVLAERFAYGGIYIDEAKSDSENLDPTSLRIGPESYRLRGGGANSNRGFSAGTLGVGLDGGIRRWEGSLELRIPLGENVGMALFFDVGDVNDEPRTRWQRLNASTGLGFRYYTPFAPIRFDAGWRIPSLQAVGDEVIDPMEAKKGAPPAELRVVPSAMHLTIGEAF